MTTMTLMARMATNEELEKMNIKEAAEYLGISTRTLQRRIDNGEITPLPKPKGAIRHPKLLFLRSDVEKLIKE
jgi:excisionase family DNA binding protein